MIQMSVKDWMDVLLYKIPRQFKDYASNKIGDIKGYTTKCGIKG